MKRYFVLFLTLVLLFTITVNPMTVHAVDPASATVALGLTAGGATVSAPVVIAVVAVLLVVWGVVEVATIDIDYLVLRAKSVYESLEADAKAWVDSFTITTSPKVMPWRTKRQFKESIEKNFASSDFNMDDNVFAFPDLGVLLSLTTMNANEVLSTNALYSLLELVSSTLDDIKTEVSDFALDVSDSLSSFSTDVSQSISTVGDYITALPTQISSALSKSFDSISSGLSTLKSTVTTYTNNASTRFENAIIYNVKPYLTLISERADALFDYEIAPLLNNLKTSVTTGISSAVSELSLGFAGVKEYLAEIAFASGTTGNPSGSNDLPNMKVNGALGMWYFGQAGELLKKYATPLLAGGAIFNLFAEVPFISDLLTFSLSIGIVGALLGIAISAFNKDDRNSAKATKAKRGGPV